MGNEQIYRQRIFSIDVLRGLAILGIFFINIFSFHTPYLYVDIAGLAHTKMDAWVFALIDIFVQASFYPLFAMLFGYGLMIMKEKIEARGESFYTIAVKRMFILLIIGLIHANLFWPGDILVTYAIFGFLLLLFARLSAKVLSFVAIMMYSIPNLWLFFQISALETFIAENNIPLYDEHKAAEVTAIYQNGSFLEVTVQRFQDWLMQTGNGLILLTFMVFPLILFGAGLAKEKRLVPNESNNRFWRWVLVFSLPAGGLLKLTPYISEKNIAIEHVQDVFGGSLLTLSYIAIIYFLCHKERVQKLFIPFGFIGKMSLSNYLFQSILCSLIFYSYGLGLYGQVTYTQSTFLAIVIYSIQLLLSSYWLKHFRMGPLEWIGRGLAYGKFSQNKIEMKGV